MLKIDTQELMKEDGFYISRMGEKLLKAAGDPEKKDTTFDERFERWLAEGGLDKYPDVKKGETA
jgi:hypothetical protein